jgi:hypothetical protein
MWLPWFKPPREIICPICGARVLVDWDKSHQFEPKPYCDHCGWNVKRARRHFLVEIGQFVISATLMAVMAWAVTGMRWGVVMVCGWVLVFMGAPIIKRFCHLPPSRSVPPLQPLAGIAYVSRATLEAVTPRLRIIIEGLIVVLSAAAIVFLPRDLDPGLRRFPGIRHQLLFVILVTVFAAYQLGWHSIELFRLVRSIGLERHLAQRAMIGEGRVIESKSGRIRYEFLDYASQGLRGAGRDYTLGLYEDMPLSVLYDPDNPSVNMPVVGLQFHRQRGM